MMCGEMAGDPINIPVLMGLGLKELSMNSGSIPIVKQVIRKLDSTETEKLVEKILKMRSVPEISDLIKTSYKNILPLGDSDEQH